MSLLVKPQYDLRIRDELFDKPISEGLIACGGVWHKPLRNIVTGEAATATSFDLVPAAAGGQLTPQGLVHQTDASLTGSVIPAVRSGDIGKASAFVLFRPTTDVTGSSLNLINVGVPGNNPFFGLRWDSTNERVRLVNNDNVVSPNGSVVAGNWYTAGGTMDDVANSKRIFLQGENVESNSTVDSRNWDAIGIGRRYDTDTNLRFSGQIAVLYIWDRILNALEMLWLHLNPFGLLSVEEDVFGFVAAVGVTMPVFEKHYRAMRAA